MVLIHFFNQLPHLSHGIPGVDVEAAHQKGHVLDVRLVVSGEQLHLHVHPDLISAPFYSLLIRQILKIR